MEIVISVLFTHLCYFAVNVILQRLDGDVPVIGYAKVVVLRFIMISGP
jgi:hypothetical protein